MGLSEFLLKLRFFTAEEVITMSRDNNNNNNDSVPFVKIVYTTVRNNGKVELVPLEWYADGSVRKSR